MALDYILRRFKEKTGLESDTAAQRQNCLDIINEAAEEFYDSGDFPQCLREATVMMVSSTEISLPSFVGVPRALSAAANRQNFTLSTMRPRYATKNWSKDAYTNFRDKGMSPVAVTIENFAPPVVTVTEIEDPPITVTIIGSTENASRVVETKTIDALSVQFETPFETYESITKDRINSVNVIVTDADDRELSVIYNYELAANYRIFDASEFLSTFDENADNEFAVDVLFKQKYVRLHADRDEFMIPGYDNVIINKAVQLHFEDRGNVEKASMADAKAARTANRKARDMNAGKENRVDPMPHPHDRLLNRKGYYY